MRNKSFAVSASFTASECSKLRRGRSAKFFRAYGQPSDPSISSRVYPGAFRVQGLMTAKLAASIGYELRVATANPCVAEVVPQI